MIFRSYPFPAAPPIYQLQKELRFQTTQEGFGWLTCEGVRTIISHISYPLQTVIVDFL
jgi:hypothetical protein